MSDGLIFGLRDGRIRPWHHEPVRDTSQSEVMKLYETVDRKRKDAASPHLSHRYVTTKLGAPKQRPVRVTDAVRPILSRKGIISA